MGLKRKHTWVGLIVVVVAVGVVGRACMSQTSAPPVGPVAVAEGVEDFTYDDYAAALKYVNDDALVDYRGLKADRGRLDAFAGALGRLDPAVFAGWSDEDKIAFWINAYNALTLKAIIDNYPIRPRFTASLRFPDNSIRQIKGVWDKIRFPVMGRPMTLDGTEHERLRAQFNEPRIHLALVCAAMGCPPLRNEPFLGEKLGEQLADQTRVFLGNPKKFRIDRDTRKVRLSSIFKWFGGDFVKTYGTDARFAGYDEVERAVLNYVSGHLSEEDAAYLAGGGYGIEYLPYDWTLNEQPAKK